MKNNSYFVWYMKNISYLCNTNKGVKNPSCLIRLLASYIHKSLAAKRNILLNVWSTSTKFRFIILCGTIYKKVLIIYLYNKELIKYNFLVCKSCLIIHIL